MNKQATVNLKSHVIKKIVMYREQTLALLTRNVTGTKDLHMAHAWQNQVEIWPKLTTIGVTVSNGKHQKLATKTASACGTINEVTLCPKFLALFRNKMPRMTIQVKS